jgi:thiamine biosynthesis lipoprotein
MHPKPNKLYLAQTRFLFHCNIKIKTPVEYGELLIDECFKILRKFDLEYNSYSVNSYFDRINSYAGTWVEVDEHVLEIVRLTNKVTALTGGAYNITLMPLLRLWGFYSPDESTLPDSRAIAEAVNLIQNSPVQIAGNQVKTIPGQEIITGSFMKSYAVDQVLQFLRAEGVTEAVINAGGSTIAALNSDEQPFWTINIPHPIEEGSLKQLKLSNACFSMSGRKEHFRLLAGKMYGHIINARTGWPSDTLQSAVISDSAFLSDVLSTALFAVDASDLSRVTQKLNEAFPHRFTHYTAGEQWEGEELDFADNFCNFF